MTPVSLILATNAARLALSENSRCLMTYEQVMLSSMWSTWPLTLAMMTRSLAQRPKSETDPSNNALLPMSVVKSASNLNQSMGAS